MIRPFVIVPPQLAALIGSHRNYDSAVRNVTRVLAEKTVDTIQMRALMEKTGVRKKKDPEKANDPRPLIDTANYIMGMHAAVTETGTYGIRGDFEAMKRLEFGTRRQPPRPHVAKALRVVTNDTRKLMKEFIRELSR